MAKYTNKDIKKLKNEERVRKCPSVVFGDDGLGGCCHSFFEILSNSIDEARDGYGDTINITKYIDGSVSVEDFGRGIPVDWNESENEYNYKLVFEELYAGGKYDSEGDNYEFSLGLNGMGLCATQYVSEYMDATIYRDNTKYSLHFEKGKNVGGLTKEVCKKHPTGSFIKWKPDLEVFNEVDIPLEYFYDILKRQAVVNKGLHLVFKIEKEDETYDEVAYYYEKGIEDYVNEVADNTSLNPAYVISAERTGKDREDKKPYKVKMEIAFTFSNTKQLTEYYHNSSWLEHGGSPDKAVRSAFLSSIDKYARKLGKYNKSESKITIQDVLDCLIIVTNSFSTQTSYENQTKKAINNKFIQEAMTDFLKTELEVFFTENTDMAAKVIDQVLINKRSRENAEKSRITIKKKLTSNLDIQNRVEKFIDCRSTDTSIRELFIVEGDSALGSCKLARDAQFQAVMPIRGKILNCLKADLPRIFKSEIITDLIKVLGCGIEVATKGSKDLHSFNLSNLRWDKIIICTDADVDGYQIRTLVMTMIYRLAPSLFKEGKVYIVESPLYEIVTKKKTYFAYTDAEKNKICSKITDKYTLNRSKGLGENEPEMMSLTTMKPETRRLIQILPDEAEEMAKMYDLLLGDNLQGRKEYIEKNGHLYLDDLDLD